jgi:hypothetical protein
MKLTLGRTLHQLGSGAQYSYPQDLAREEKKVEQSNNEGRNRRERKEERQEKEREREQRMVEKFNEWE